MPTPTAAVLALLTTALNWTALDPTQRNLSIFAVRPVRNGSVLDIKAADPVSHLAGLVMRTTPQQQRRRLRDEGKPNDAILGFYLDRGIFTSWRFIGSTGPDSLTFGPQGVIISKRLGGVVDFGRDQVRDTFTFTNTIDVKRCSERHGITCHPLNHLQRVTIKNFGPQDVIKLQGRVFRHNQVKNGALPGVPVERLKVEVMT